jgi:ATP-dependent DNA helicase DinG
VLDISNSFDDLNHLDMGEPYSPPPATETPSTVDVPAPEETIDGIVNSLNLFFPFDEIRPTQVEILGAVAEARTSGKKFTVIEAPTGVGKTGVSMTVGLHDAEFPPPPDPDSKLEYQDGGYILTSQKSLTAQMVADFSQDGLVEIRGKRNYSCDRHKTHCEDGQALNASGKTCETCPYRKAKNTFLGAGLGVTNYSYFIAETRYGGEIMPRQRLILDEGHNIEREVLSVASIAITTSWMDLLDVQGAIPNFTAGNEGRIRDWISARVYPKLTKYCLDLQSEANEEAERSGVEKKPKELLEAQGFRDRLNRFTETDNLKDWLGWTDESGELTIKPLIPAMFTDELLFRYGRNVLILSATILDFKTFRQTMGIRPSQAVSFQAASDFPAANRRIIFWPAGSMSFKNIGTTTPILLRRIENLLGVNFAGKKGIIHTHTYKINEQLVNMLRRGAHGHRIITHDRNPESRERAILQHMTRPDDTVLLSPSMTEGLDLKDDLSRFQIICKVPFPYLDPYNKARMERSPDWYRLQTAITLMQATGRSIRSVDDYAITVILDSDFARFLADAGSILPDWWKSAIEVK